MSKFFSLSDPRPVEVNPVGDSVVQEYELEYSPQGVPHLVPTGTYDLYEVIQSFRDECDLGKIFQRYANGDVMALNKRQGVYEDISDMPQDIFAAANLVERVESIYNGLDEATRSRVGSFEDFLKNPLVVLSDHPASDAGSSESVPADPAGRDGGDK
jgi:hypothetical protein